MTYKGINYDTGTRTINGRLTRYIFDLTIVSKELDIIKNELHCNVIRISGVDIERMVSASEIAAPCLIKFPCCAGWVGASGFHLTVIGVT